VNAAPLPNDLPTDLVHDAFYRFVRIDDAEAFARYLRDLTRGLTGALVVAPEGLNGMLAGPAAALDAFRATLTADARFAGLSFKRSGCSTPPFHRMKVHVRPNLLSLGAEGTNAIGRPGVQLSALEWRALLDTDDVVVIDNRNSFEHRLGRFRGALDPNVGNFRDLPAFIDAHRARWQAEGKRIAMYCTGGIRCEKTAAWLDDIGLPVLQLEGGILQYFIDLPDAERDWQGECFVFDNRIALDTRLQETATTAEQVYADSAEAPDEAWRLQRARRLAAAGG